MLIPRHLAAEVATQAAAQERCEEFIMEKIRRGRSIIGVYPPDEKTLLEYEEVERGRAGKG